MRPSLILVHDELPRVATPRLLGRHDRCILLACAAEARLTQLIDMVGKVAFARHSFICLPFLFFNALPHWIKIKLRVEGLAETDSSTFSYTVLNSSCFTHIGELQRHVFLF